MAAQSFLPTISLLLFFLLLLTLSVSGHGGHHDEENDPDSSTTPPLPQHPHLRSKTLIIIKIFCLIIVFFGTFIGGVSPYFFKWNENFLVLGTQFAGGVFLGTALMHFLSDSNETFGDLTNKEYPFAFMLACAGYLLTMLADCVISYVYGSNQGDDGVKPNDLETPGVVTQDKSKNGSGTTSSPSQLQVENRNDTHTHFGNPSFSSATSLGDSILLIVALCSHSVFEGIAIGVAETKADAWKALWTISLHKVFAAIAMGIALLRMIPNRPLLSCVTYAFAFAISTPIGVAIGIIIDATTQGVVADWIYAISMAIACGVFIYVSINHLLSKGYTPQGIASFNTQHYKFLAVALGIGVISVVMIWDT